MIVLLACKLMIIILENDFKRNSLVLQIVNCQAKNYPYESIVSCQKYCAKLISNVKKIRSLCEVRCPIKKRGIEDGEYYHDYEDYYDVGK